MPTLSAESQNPQINGVAVTAAGPASVSVDVLLTKPWFSIQLKTVSGAALTGTWKIELTDDLVDTIDVTAQFFDATGAPINHPTAFTGTRLAFLSAPVNAQAFKYVRVTFAATINGGTVTASVRCP